MKNNKINVRFVVLLLITLGLGIYRIMASMGEEVLWNFSPLGAMALFGGTYFVNREKAYLMPLAILFFSDVILMKTLYIEHSEGLLYAGWYWTYGSFILMVFWGRFYMARKGVTFVSYFLSGLMASFIHYIVTDFGVWIGGGINLFTGMPYEKTWEGFLQCYAQAIPYLKNFCMATLFFGGVLFGGFELARRKFSILDHTLTRPQEV